MKKLLLSLLTLVLMAAAFAGVTISNLDPALSMEAGKVTTPGNSALIREYLGEILERREFKVRPEASMTFWEKFEESLIYFLKDLLSGKKLDKWIAISMAIVILLIASWMIAFFIASLRGRWVRDSVAPAGAAMESKISNPETLEREAAGLAESGNYRSALRNLYYALLLTLDRKGILEFEKSRTNWENLHIAKVRLEICKPFTAFTHIFDEKWYGQKPCTIDDFRQGKRLLGEILNLC